MWWFTISVIAFFLLALASVMDKFLLTKTKIVPVSFAFFITLFAALGGSVLIFFDKSFAVPQVLLWEMFLGGATYFFGLYFMFLAVERAEVSKANPIIVSLTPISVFLLSLYLNLQLVDTLKIIGVILVIGSGYLLSQTGAKATRLNKITWLFVILSSLALGASNVYNKIGYDNFSFITAFVWIRWFSAAVAIAYVTLAGKWPSIFLKNKSKAEEVKNKSAFGVLVVGQIAGSVGVILMQVGIKMGNVILVTALNSLQFFFVIFLVYLLSKFYPKVLQENISKGLIIKKVLLSLMMGAGLILVLI